MGVFGNRLWRASICSARIHEFTDLIIQYLYNSGKVIPTLLYIASLCETLLYIVSLWKLNVIFISRTWEGKGEERERSWVDDTWCFEQAWLCCHSNHVEFHSEYSSGGFLATAILSSYIPFKLGQEVFKWPNWSFGPQRAKTDIHLFIYAIKKKNQKQTLTLTNAALVHP